MAEEPAANSPPGSSSALAELATFLRARRAARKPEAVGLSASSRRRTPGLRREELAVLAGISTDYYTRLEQGRETNPSPSVVRSLASALGLNADEHAYLRSLAAPQEPARRSQPTRRGDDDAPRPGVVRILHSLHDHPAYLVNHSLDVLAWNPMAAALYGDFAREEPPRRNIVWMTFRDPDCRSLYRDWETVAQRIVANLRAQTAGRRWDSRIADLVADLSANDDQFQRWWNRYDVKAERHGAKRFRHPLVGDLELQHEVLMIPGESEYRLTVFTATPGSKSEASLEKLRALTT